MTPQQKERRQHKLDTQAVRQTLRQAPQGLRRFTGPELDRPNRRQSVNVGSTERWVSGVVGGLLIYTGLVRRTIPGALLALFGGGLIRRGVSGHCALYENMER